MIEGKSLKIEDLYSKLESSRSGLSSVEAVKRLKDFGPNDLREKKPESLFIITARQFFSPFVLVLVIAALILVFLHEYVDAGVIVVVLLVNAVIGVVQEGKAQNTLRALKKFTKTKTLVLRDGHEIRIDSSHVVPGDVLVLRSGDKVPADARLVEARNLRISEAALTGESESVSKEVHRADDERDNLGIVLKGTYINAGTGRALVFETGEGTVIGSISKKLESLDSEVPLKKNIRQLSRLIIIGTVLASVAILLFGFWAGYPFREMFFIAVAIAVSVIPEGLPVVITLVLALGVYRMGKNNALVKRMQAVEALGQADVVAVDKTGTITRNELMVGEIRVGGNIYNVSGSGYESTGSVLLDGKEINPTDHEDLMFATRIGVLTSSATIYKKEEGGNWEIIGDPTEAAITVVGQKIGLSKDLIQEEQELIHDVPFQSELQYHASLYKDLGRSILYVVGAPEKLIGLSGSFLEDGKIVSLTEEKRKRFMEDVQEMSLNGQRVLVTAFKETDSKDDISDLTIVGILGMQDSIREGVKDSVEIARRSGVEVVMITGDFKGTAVSIARDAGIFKEGDKVLTGVEIEALSVEQLAKELEDVTVFARVTPEQKLNIVNAYKKRGQKIAMTGDGVNDALSLVSADLGIGMGLSGTEVAKEAADIVLLDDDIKSIVSAIEEGRGIYATIRKVILYLFSTNLSELFVIVLALSLFLPLPLQPSQILWLNLITDGFLVLAFVFDPNKSENVLNLRSKGAFIINKLMFIRMVLMSAVMTIGTITMFMLFYEGNVVKGWTIAMTTMAFFQLFNVLNVRSIDQTVFRKETFSNIYLWISAVLVVLLQLFAIYTPFMNKFLKTMPISMNELGLIVLVTVSVVLFEEIRKLIQRKYA